MFLLWISSGVFFSVSVFVFVCVCTHTHTHTQTHKHTSRALARIQVHSGFLLSIKLSWSSCACVLD